MAVETGDRDRPEVDRTAAEGIDRPVPGGQLLVEIAALPGDEQAARRQQRERQLDELPEWRDGARGDRRPATAMTAIGRERLGPNGADPDPPG
ncbi:MAG TPA: hypothetical protein VFY18_02960 [Candidatus Limnocylindrales bacterium]|nr:hypothetical protein [Candidatus Limnocylindrales bacterium]